jgi:hypothetical protein
MRSSTIQALGFTANVLWVSGTSMAEYRRGLEKLKHETVWQKLWHFSERCADYPTRNFVTRTDRPPDDELCARCNSLA